MSDPGRLDDRRAGLSAAKRALLEQRLKGTGKPTPEPLIPGRDTSQPAPLSAGQRRIWFLHQENPDDPAYTMHQTFILDRTVDRERFRDAVQTVVDRHEALRCAIVERDGELVMADDDGLPIAIDVIDHRSRPEAEREAAALAAATERVGTPFDLGRPPLLRLLWQQLRDDRQWLTLTVHHIIADEASLELFWRETCSIYASRLAGEAIALPPLARQYGDFAAWEHTWLDTAEATAQRSWWRTRLADAPGAAPLPGAPLTGSDPERPSGALAAHPLPASLSGQVETLARQGHTSPFIVQLAGVFALLYRYTGATDLAIAIPASLRSRPELVSIVGFFLNTLVIRVSLEGTHSFRDILETVRRETLAAFERQQVPFDRVMTDLRLAQGGEAARPFRVMVVQQQDPLAAFSLPGIRAEYRQLDAGSAKFDLTLFAGSGPSAALMAEYRTDRLTATAAEALLRHWAHLFGELTASPDVPLAKVAMMPPVERATVVDAWNDTARPLPDTTVTARIAERAAEAPDAVAVRCGTEQRTYGELEEQAGRLAARLRERGLKPGDIAGICLPRSADLPVAILAALKAGGAYLPLDPGYPAARLAAMIADARPALVISDGSGTRPWGDADVPVVAIGEAHGDGPSTASARASGGDDPAYLIYTSGSTGTPRGVVVSHRNLLASTLARQEYYPDPPRGYLLPSSAAFDSSVAGIFWTLVSGGALVIPEDGGHADPDHLADLIERHRLTHILAIPSLYRHLLELRPDALGSLTTVIVAGEACPPDLPAAHFQRLPDCGLFNEYGPTEATVWCSVFDCREPFEGGTVPIGRPIPNARLYVVDRDGNPLPPGIEGELLVGGAGVTTGYLNHDDATAARFIPDPFSGDPAARLYRTGDRACWTPDGHLLFRGRVDNQVKLRGHRIDPGDIEAALLAHPDVREAVVVPVRRGTDGTLEELAERVPPSTLAALLDAVEALPDPDAGTEAPSWQRRVDGADFRLSLTVRRDGFVAPPRAAQRNWLLGQWFSEAAADLEHLDALAKRFVTGSDQRDELYDDATEALSADAIMEDWQTPIMKAMAEQVCGSHGDVLEIGFGRGVSAGFIQAEGVRSHTIIEPNRYIAETLFPEWRRGYPGRDIRLVRGRWQDVLDRLATYDGVFFHAVPLSEEEFAEQMVHSITFAEHFFATAAALLRPGGAFSYLTTEIDSLSRRHQRALFEHFSAIELRRQPLDIPPDTRDLWWADSMVIIKATK